MRDPKSRALEKAADKLLKAYEAIDIWNSNRKEKRDAIKNTNQRIKTPLRRNFNRNLDPYNE